MKEDLKVYNDVQLIGDTPYQTRKVIKLEGNYFAKVEAFNPGHSSKDKLHFIL